MQVRQTRKEQSRRPYTLNLWYISKSPPKLINSQTWKAKESSPQRHCQGSQNVDLAASSLCGGQNRNKVLELRSQSQYTEHVGWSQIIE